MSNIFIVKKGEKEGRREQVVNGDMVDVYHVSKHENKACYQLLTRFDFSEVDRETILQLAAKQAVIDWRQKSGFRKCKNPLDDAAWYGQRVNVAELVAQRKRLSAKERAERQTAKLSRAEKRALAERLLAEASEDSED